MPDYAYVALDASGGRRTGTLTAPDQRTVVQQLKEMGCHPTEVREADTVSPAAAGRWSPFFRIPHGDLTTFTRQLSDLIGARLPILRCFEALIEHTESRKLQRVLQAIRDDLSGGTSIADALERHPRAFAKVYTSMVRAGEASGQLPDILRRLAEFMEKEREQRVLIKSMLAYPAFVVTIGVTGVAFLLAFVIPRFTEIYDELGQVLPGPTQMLIHVSSFLAQFWWAVLLALVGAIVLARFLVGTPRVRYALDVLKLRNRITGKLTQKVIVSRFARTMATLLRGGVDVLSAFTVVRDGVGNALVARALDEVQARVREGETVSSQLRETGVFPALVPHMVALGEETGNVEGVLQSMADMYDMEVDAATRAIVAIMGPAVIVALGAVVFFIISAMLMPIFQLRVGM